MDGASSSGAWARDRTLLSRGWDRGRARPAALCVTGVVFGPSRAPCSSAGAWNVEQQRPGRCCDSGAQERVTAGVWSRLTVIQANWRCLHGSCLPSAALLLLSQQIQLKGAMQEKFSAYSFSPKMWVNFKQFSVVPARGRCGTPAGNRAHGVQGQGGV